MKFIKHAIDAASPFNRLDKLHFEDMVWRIEDILAIQKQSNPL